jgi:hypothetical protein
VGKKMKNDDSVIDIEGVKMWNDGNSICIRAVSENNDPLDISYDSALDIAVAMLHITGMSDIEMMLREAIDKKRHDITAVRQFC